jgi:hypothetical protein
MSSVLQCLFLPHPVSVVEDAWREFEGTKHKAPRPEDARRGKEALVSLVPADGGCFIVARTDQRYLLLPDLRRLFGKRPSRVRERDLERFRLALDSQSF